MELILMSALTTLAICVGVYIGYRFGVETTSEEVYNIGYGEGYLKGIEESVDGFPTSLDGKFFSTDAALRQMSKKEGDD